MRYKVITTGFVVFTSLLFYGNSAFAETLQSNVLKTNATTKSPVSINSYRVENVTDEGFDFIIKFSGEEVTYLSLPYWKRGNYNGMVTSNEKIEKIGNNEFKLHIKMKDIGSGTEYVYVGVHPSTANGHYFIEDLAIKLDTVNPELSLSLSNTKWTNKDISLKAVSSDNQNIIEKLYYYDKSNKKTDYDMFSTPKMLIINAHGTSYIADNYKNNPNVTIIAGSSFTSVQQLNGYDVVIYDGCWWGISEAHANMINQAFEEGVSIITNMNDSPSPLSIGSSVGTSSGAYTFNSFADDPMGVHYRKGRANRFAYLIDGLSESDGNGFHLLQAGEGTFTLSNVTIGDGRVSPGILIKTHSNGNKWIHAQSVFTIFTNSALNRAIDELMHGTMKSRQSYEKSFTIGENGTYTVEVEDFSGNKTKKSINVTNIDKTKPTIDISGVPESLTNQNVRLTINATDNESGVKSITLPNGSVVNGSSATYTVNANGDYTFKVTDNVGNTSTKTINIDIPVLTSQDYPNKNMIRLDWKLNNSNDKTFKVYQKKPGSSVFQTISSTNYDGTDNVKVLNVYPPHSTTETYTTWKGEKVTLPISASLKRWLEEPNSENAKGYGKGIISVDAVLIDDFNSSPDSFLKNADGSYKYDVIMFGSLDNNGGKDLSESSLEVTKEFIDSGRGVLFGHDTVSKWSGKVNFPKLESYINVKTYGFTTNIDWSNPEQIWIVPWSGGTEISVTKKGALTNYPWIVGDIGTKLTVPYTHTNSQIAKGDVWMKFTNPKSDSETNVPIDTNEYSDNGEGTNMAYLTTYNNTAMIQTGHAINRYSATIDEQKLLANTLFYLNQLSNETYLDDYSGQDVSAPNTPKVNGYLFTSDGYINFTFSAVTDNGSTYEYYVESTSKDSDVTVKSNKVTDSITSGIKGYSYVVDNNATTIPDDTIEQSNSATIKYKYSNTNNLYVHIKAIDNAGNISETHHYKLVDNTKPIINTSQTPTTWTNGSVTIKATATDTGSGVKNITLPDGTVVTGSTATYTVTTNGNYIFKAIDYVGNVTTQTVNITNIDKTKPTISITGNPTSWTKNNATLTITASDSQSGIKQIEKPDGTVVNGTSTTYTVSANGTYTFKVTDNVGNVLTQTVNVTKIDKTNPTISVTGNPTNWTKNNATLTITGTDSASGVKQITLPNGQIVTGSSTTYTVTANGNYIFKVTDHAGNEISQTVSVTKIDKTAPTISITGNPTSWTNKDVTLTIKGSDSASGVKQITLPNNQVVTGSSTTYTVTTNGNYTFKVTDNAGNEVTQTVNVTKIDKAGPVISYTLTPNTWTNGNVTINLNVTDAGVGLKEIYMPNGTIVSTSTTSYTVSKNGAYYFKAVDNLGHETVTPILVNNIDKELPSVNINNNQNWTNQDVQVNIVGND